MYGSVNELLNDGTTTQCKWLRNGQQRQICDDWSQYHGKRNDERYYNGHRREFFLECNDGKSDTGFFEYRV